MKKLSTSSIVDERKMGATISESNWMLPNKTENAHTSLDLVVPHWEIYPKIIGQRHYVQRCFYSFASNSNTKIYLSKGA